MDNSMKNNLWEKLEELVLLMIIFAALVFMVVYWK